MLTTSTISMSLGSDLTSACQISSDRTDTPAISFAESFSKSAPTLGDDMPPQSDSGEKVRSEPEGNHIVSSIKSGVVDSSGVKMKAVACGVLKTEDKYKNISNSIVSKNATIAMTVTGEMLSGDDKSHEDVLMAIQAEIANSQLRVDNLKGAQQKPTPEVVDGVTPQSNNQAEASKIEVAASALPAVLDNGVTTVVQNKKEILISNKNENTIPSKKTAKDRDGILKTGKLSKIENKANKIDEPAGKVVEAGQITNVPSFTVQLEPQHDAYIGEASFDFAGSERSIDMNPIPASRLDHKTQEVGKIEDDSTKATVSSVADSPLQQAGTDASKAGLFTASMGDGDSAKAQSTLTADEATGLGHAQPGIVVAAASSASGIAVAQVVVSKALIPEVNSHPITAHPDSVADASRVVEVTHQTLMATPTSLEVGIANGTHGWLKIRAEMTVGGVNASLSPATSSGQEMLHRELPSLTAYLQSERVLVNALVVQPTVVPAANFQQFAGGMHDGGRGQTPHSNGQGGQQNLQDAANTVTPHLERDGTYRDAVEDKLLPLVSYGTGGRWLNVRA
jgi:hypothetical protein